MLGNLGRGAAALLLLLLAGPALAEDMGIKAADPSVVQTEDGFVAVESRGGRALLVRMAPSLDALAEARPERIWSDRDRLGEVWAPEVVYQDGRYVVYFAAGVGSDHRMYRIESSEPADGYGAAEEIALPDDKWAIDGVAFSHEGVDYFTWSGWQGDTDVQQDIFVVRLDADGLPEGERVLVGSPDQPWENVAGETPSINEGPQPIQDPDGQLHIVYSANGSWGPNYCLADLRLRSGGDPLDPKGWFQSDGCLFGANPETLAEDGTRATLAKGVGHHSFLLPDVALEAADSAVGPQPFLYHGVPAEEEPPNFWAARKWFAGAYEWVPDVAYSRGPASDSGWGIRFTE